MQKESIINESINRQSIAFGLLFDLLLSEPVINSKCKIKNDNQPNEEPCNTITKSNGPIRMAEEDDTSK